ncbi:MAG: DegV family protein [Candidatus Pacebacteria bacterium]|nr:DegV family protein [Candidatus Paceibacterota bacterium]
MEALTCKQLQKMILFSCERIERDKEEINKINVFPVPDQDTGSNLSGTLNGVKEVINGKDFSNLKKLGDAVLDGALMAAQGNTGIIYTGFMVGFFNDIPNNTQINAKSLANCFQKGHERARESIQDPKEGTILDVMEAFSNELAFQSEKSNDIVVNFENSLEKANEALLATKNKMAILKKAGVIDAGGLGFLMILETYFDVLLENEEPFSFKKLRKKDFHTKRFVQILTNRYEVVALMRDVFFSEKEMREKLQSLGDCLDIIQVKERVKIHIHTDDPYEVRDIIRTFGEEETMRIEDMAREVVGEESVVKNKIGIVIDEACGLNEKNLKYYKIESIPYRIDWGGIDKLKGESVSLKLKTAKEKGFNYVPKIHSIDADFFKEAFKKQLRTFNEVICITSSNDYFGAFDSAREGREMLDSHEKSKIHIIDSKSIGAGEAVLVLKAIDLINEQKPAQMILKELQETIVKSFGIINSPYVKSKKYSDKIKKVIEKNKFVLIEAKNEFIPIETLRKEECIDKIVNKIRKDFRKNEKGLAVISHGDNEIKAKELKTKLKPLNIQVSFISLADPAVSLKLGYKGVFIGYIKI